jgi:hypothetical protein
VDFIRQRLINFPRSIGLGIVPKPVVTVPIIIPARMIQNGVKANTLHRDAGLNCGAHFLRNIGEPAGPVIAFGAGFRDEERSIVTVVDFGNDFTEGPVFRLVPPDRRTVVPPLIAVIVVETDHIQKRFIAPQLGLSTPAQHVPCLEHR